MGRGRTGLRGIGAGQRVLRGASGPAHFLSWLVASCPSVQELIISEAKHHVGRWAAGGPGPHPPSLPRAPRRSFFQQQVWGQNHSLFHFSAEKQREAHSEDAATPSLAPGACTQVDILL